MINLQRSNRFGTNLYLLFTIICLIYSEKSKPPLNYRLYLSTELQLRSTETKNSTFGFGFDFSE